MTYHYPLSDFFRVTGSGGGKGGGGKKGGGDSDPNTLRSKARARMLEAISEGEIEGFVDEAGNVLTGDNRKKAIFFDQTPIWNADGSENFKNVLFDVHTGLADEGYFNGQDAVETPFNVEVQVKKATGPVQRTIVDENADAVRVIARIPALVENDTENGGLKKTSVSYAFEVRAYNGTWQRVVTNNLKNQKATSPFQIAHRLPLPAGGSPWDVRMVRLTDDSDKTELQNETWWEGYIVLVEGKFIYPHTAMAGLEVNAEDMGSSIPPRGYRVKGIKVNIPSNYDPVTRTYTGIWNGSFKIGWTNSPAWIFYDLLINDRYGLGEFVKPEIIDKWSLYTIAQYCDQLVPSGYRNGDTGEEIWEPRFSFNGVINSRDDAYFVLQQVSTAWRGMAYWSLGQIFATADMPADPVRIVAPANVLGGEFTYSGTAMKARHSVIIVSWNDPNDFYRPATELVINQEMLQKYGWREKRLQLTGCTSRGLAHRYGKWILDTEQHETETVSYQASWDHIEVKPGNIIAIADPRKAQVRLAGRIVSHRGNLVELDYDFDRIDGKAYELTLTMPDGSLERRPIVNWLDERTLEVDEAFSQTAVVDAMFAITGDVVMRQYRVLSVEEVEPNIFKVTALFHDPLKFARIEQGVVFEPLPYSRPTSAVQPPTGLYVQEVGYISEGKNFSSLHVSWTPPADYMNRGFVVSVDTPADGRQILGQTFNPWTEMQNTGTGTYTFYVQTIGYNGVLSEAAEFVFEAMGPTGFARPTVTNLRLKDNPTGISFGGVNMVVEWDNNFALSSSPTAADGSPQHVPSPHYAFNTVKIYEATSSKLLRTARVTGESFVYELASNAHDSTAAGLTHPSRSLRVDVTVSDVFGRESVIASKVFSNPAPSKLTPSFNAAGSTIVMTYPPQSDEDFRGVLVWRSNTAGINIATADLVYDGLANPLSMLLQPRTTYYFKVAAYDAFSKTDINVSDEIVISTGTGFDEEPPAKPTGLTVTSALLNERARLHIGWNANTEEDLLGYDLEIKQGTGNFVPFLVTANSYELDGIPGVVYQVQLRARDKSGNTSPYTNVVTHTAVKDTTAPGAPTDLTASAGLTSIWLEWANPTDEDLSYIEILEGETNVAANATVIANALGSSFARTGIGNVVTRYYWVRAVDTSGNKSDLSAIATATTAKLPDVSRISFTGLQLTPNSPNDNRVAWPAFSATYGAPGVAPTTKAITAGSVLWSTGTLYIYYVEGETTLRSTTSISTLFVNKGHLLGIYKGDTDIQLADGKTVVDGNTILTGTIGATQLVTNDAIITNTAQLADAIVSSAKIEDLDAAKIKADTVLAGTIKIGTDTLETVRSRAENPASRVNAGATLIDPGKITISGTTKLSDWRRGGDTSKIDGGAISANTVDANKLTIGQRGVHLEGIQFEHNKPATNKVSWTAGSISYVNDAGTPTSVAITAGSATWTGAVMYIFWQKGASAISTTTVVATAMSANNIVLAVYRGDKDLVTEYGRTVIDGDNIKTGSIGAEQISVASLGAISATIGTLQSASTGARMVLQTDKLSVYDASNVLRVRIGNLA